MSICRNNAREVLADWFIAKRPRKLLTKFAMGTIKAVVRANEKIVRVCTLFERFFYKLQNYSRTKNRVRVRGRVRALDRMDRSHDLN